MDSDKPRGCHIYGTFGVCEDGDTCFYSHEIQPFFSRKAFFTVALDNPRTNGSVSFHPMEGRSTTKHTYYIPLNSKWYNLSAVQGDIVELQISDKKHNKLHFARMTKILLPVNIITRQVGSIPCFTHITYGDCRGGLQCSMVHLEDGVLDQHFHVATVLSVLAPSDNGQCELHVNQLNEDGDVVNMRYYLPGCQEWFTMNVSEGNLVIVQESERTMRDRNTGLLHYGKVAAVLHESQALSDVSIPLEKRIRRGFVVEKQGVTFPSVAYSLSACPQDKQCNRIGIHVIAAALKSGLTKLDCNLVPSQANGQNRMPTNAFNANLTRLALSVYRHSSCDNVEGPMITPLIIPSTKVFLFREGSGQSNLVEYFDTLWRVFGTSSLIEDFSRTAVAHLMVDFPETWKYRYLVRQMKVFFNKQVMAFLKSKEERYVLVKNLVSEKSLPKEELFVPAKSVQCVKAAWQLTEDEKKISLATLLGTAKRGVSTFWQNHYGKHWQHPEEVVSTKQFYDDKLMRSTLPTTKIADFVNQQIVLSMIISPRIHMYSKNEVSGIIVSRLPTPTMLKTVIRKVTGRAVNLQFCGKHGRKNGNKETVLQQLFPGQIFLSSNDEEVQVDTDPPVSSISTVLKGLTSDEYCNAIMVRLPGQKLSALADAVIDSSVGAREIKKMVADLVAVDYERPTPYELQEQGTKITLQRGVELQLQVSMKKDTEKKVSDLLRLLRIGKDCHLCLFHLNSPHSAFGGLTKLISEKTSEMNEQTYKDVLRGINIKWQDQYFSGGRFSAPNDITTGNLLCIRQEIAKSGCVWTCHAVVEEVSGTCVKFSVCSLGQEKQDVLWEEDNHFVVEVVHLTSESR